MTMAAAQRALSLWPVHPVSCSMAAQRENIVYRVTDRDGRAYALRVHRPGYRSDAEIGSELQWMAGLESNGLDVPRPIASVHGRLIEESDGHLVDLLTWLDGRPMGRVGQPLDLADRFQTFFNLGAAMARLHAVSDRWTPPAGFMRPRWDIDGLTGEDPLWGRFWDNPALGNDEREMLIRARDMARTALLAFGTDLDYGLIHADLVRENVLVDGDRVRLIDFDDSGFGFRLFDIATALLKNRGEPDYPALEAALLAGYRQHRSLDDASLHIFMMLRAFTYLGWIIPRLNETGAPARNLRNIAPALELARAFLG